MRRRTYLGASVFAVTGLAGCTGVLTGGGSDVGDNPEQTPGGGSNVDDNPEQTPGGGSDVGDNPEQTPGGGSDVGDDPEQTLRAYLKAGWGGDYDRAIELVHSDSPMMDRMDDDGGSTTDQNLTLTIEETEVRTQDDDTAEVIVEYTLSNQDGDSRTDRFEYELRTENGNWRIWDSSFPGERPPQVGLSFTDRPDEDVVVVRHNGGDTIERTERITIQVDGSPQGTFDQVIAETFEVGMSGTIDVPADSTGEIRFLWDAGNRTDLLAIHEYDVR